MMQTQHMHPQGGYRVSEQQYANGAYGMMPSSHAAGDSQQRHNAALANGQQQRMSAAGAADSPYANMRHPRSQMHAGQYAMQGGPMGSGVDPNQHAGYSTNSSAGVAGNGMATGGAAKPMSNMMPSYTGARQGMQQQIGDMSMPQQMQQAHAQQHVQHPSQPNMMPQGTPGAPGAGGMGAQGRDGVVGNTVTRSARESLGDGLGNLEPTPIDQIGLSADDDDFSDLADIIADQPGGADGGPDMSQGHGPELTGDPYAANAQLTPGGQNHGRMVSPRQWNPSMELMPQSMASPYTSPGAMQQHPQQHEHQRHMQMQQQQGGAHGLGTRSAAQQPNGQAQWMAEQHMHHAQQIRHQQHGYAHGQHGYGQGPGQQQGYTHAAQQQQQQRHQAEQHAMFRHQEEQRTMTQQQQQPNDAAQVCNDSAS